MKPGELFRDQTIQLLSFRIPDDMHSWKWYRAGLLILFLCAIIPTPSAFPAGNSTTYSFVHLSDTQNLATYYPDTYNFTFSYLDSVKTPYNITGIIITGDLVNTWDSRKEWDVYSIARNHTSLPVYTIAGNHDTDNGKNFHYYSVNTGMPEVNYVTSFKDFDLVGINYAGASLSSDEFSMIRSTLINSPRSNVIIATHYYMDVDGTLSPLGKAIDKDLIVKPSLVLMGHMHGNFIKPMRVRGFPVIADMTNYQDGVFGGKTGSDYSAGTLYTITSVNGQVETVTARIVHIVPTPFLEDEIPCFPRDPLSTERPAVAPSGNQACNHGDLSCILTEMIEQLSTNIRHMFS